MSNDKVKERFNAKKEAKRLFGTILGYEWSEGWFGEDGDFREFTEAQRARIREEANKLLNDLKGFK